MGDQLVRILTKFTASGDISLKMTHYVISLQGISVYLVL